MGTEHITPVLEKQRRLALMILAAVCLTYFVENFLRSAASALTPVLIVELGISRGSMGLLITGYFLIYGIMQLPAGVLADVLGPRKSILWFTGFTCIGCALFYLSYRYELLLVAQIIMGIGTSVFYITKHIFGGKNIRFYKPLKERSLVYGLCFKQLLGS